jgi:hypothetical protein
MNLFQWRRPGSTNKAEDHIVKAGDIFQENMQRGSQQTIVTTSWDMGIIDRVLEELQQAVKIVSNDPEPRYLYACALQARLRGEEAEAELKRLLSDYPDFAQAQGHLKHRERWFLPFLYPQWSERHDIVTGDIAPAGREGCFITPVRVGCRRVVSLFARMPRSSIGSRYKPDQRVAIRMAYMNTPFCPVVGVYGMVDTHPTEPYTMETILSVDSYRSDWSDCSRSGYWLIRMLAQQTFCYFVMADPFNGKVYCNRRIDFDGKTSSILNSVAEQIKNIQQKIDRDETAFPQAEQYFTQRFSLDNIRF